MWILVAVTSARLIVPFLSKRHFARCLPVTRPQPFLVHALEPMFPAYQAALDHIHPYCFVAQSIPFIQATP